MSLRWPNSIVNKTFTAPTGAQSTPGLWKLNTVAEYVQQALWPQPLTYIEDVFSTYLYTGNSTGVGSSQTITNGIDLAGQGGMVWIKDRSTSNIYSNAIIDTARGRAYSITTDNTWGESTSGPTADLTSFNNNGFSLGYGSQVDVNDNGANYASWTFRKAPKFFDVVTYTGNGVAGRAISHSLGVAPGMIFVKCTSNSGNWPVYHRSTGNTAYTILNATFPADTDLNFWYNTTPTASTFTVNNYDQINGSGKTYVAYLFAHDTSSTGLIQCGKWNAGSGTTNVTLGWEPQYILFKKSSSTGSWFIVDTMRGSSETSQSYLKADSSDAESTNPNPPGYPCPTATGFKAGIAAGSFDEFIYMAIRRGPMKTPTDATKVFKPYNTTSISNAGSTTTTIYNAGFVTDMLWSRWASAIGSFYTGNRLTGTEYMTLDTTAAAATASNVVWDSNVGAWSYSSSYGTYDFQRAPGFFDVVCYAGTGAVQSINHSLGVAPEFVIVKDRTSTGPHWNVWCSGITNAQRLILNSSNQVMSATTAWNSTSPTATAFTVGTFNETNNAGDNFVTYLFASCPGVSKVGSYTGTGSTQTISCGFTGGARFVLIKRTDSTGDWWVWDTTRGMVAGTDPSLLLNSTAAEVNANSVYTTTGGFQIVTTDAGINASGGTYLFLAIA